ncbi:MAG: carboxylating nicotinate-nucleotide diphosphorylase [bacterium]|nr:carboxylating nicotinate-nucleotide diphosphorylase [bacterium]
MGAIVEKALAEDLGPGDATVNALGIAGLSAAATAVAKEAGVVCGIEVAETTFELLSDDINFDTFVEDGNSVEPGKELFRVEGNAGSILAAERVALNFLQRMSGIATLTRKFVEAVGENGPAIMDTRKTTPGLRVLEKYAVTVGGGVNHRMGLYDGIMIKDNHKRLFDDVAAAVQKAKENNPGDLTIVAEAETTEEALAAEAAGADIVMLDNFTPEEAKAAIAKMEHICQIEISGGVNLDNVGEYAKAGADRISVGELTHSAPALNISIETYIGE